MANLLGRFGPLRGLPKAVRFVWWWGQFSVVDRQDFRVWRLATED